MGKNLIIEPEFFFLNCGQKEAMRCRIHPSDPGAGVCACCLRERLSNLFAAPPDFEHTSSPAIQQKTEPSSAPPALLSSRSGYHCSCGANGCIGNRKPSLNEEKSDSIVPKSSVFNSRHLVLILWRRKKKKKKSANISPDDVEEVTRGRSKKPHVPPVNGRGMSPASKDGTEGEDRRRLSTASPQIRKAQRQQSSRKLSSYALCLNPLTRSSPSNQRNHASETEFAGEPPGTLGRRSSGVGAAVPNTFSGPGPNRSRKLVDLGKVW